MRKLIAILSTTMTIVFALALANADESNVTTSKRSEKTIQEGTPDQQPGAVTEDVRITESETDTSMPGTTGSDTTSESVQKKSSEWSTAKSCTDSSGVTYRRGQKNFERCIKEKDQMSGRVGSEPGLSQQPSIMDDKPSMDSGSGAAGEPGITKPETTQ